LEKLEKEGLIEKPFQRKQLKIRFPERGRSGRTVLTINNLHFGFEDKVSIVV
jgi:ATPase subunit of ABC transporter with duplicated ATPase domains